MTRVLPLILWPAFAWGAVAFTFPLTLLILTEYL